MGFALSLLKGLTGKSMIGEHGNNLLRALRPEDYDTLEPYLNPVEMPAGKTLYRPGDHVQTVYFPCGTAIAAYIVELPEGKGVETALIGREGAMGGIVSQGRLPSYSRCTVQTGGKFLTIRSEVLEEVKERSDSIRHLFARYADCMMAQIFQSVACNASHNIDQRAAKWIVATYERTGSRVLRITQDQLAEMLGVGRSYITRVIARFKDDGIVQTGWRQLSVTDLEAIQSIACDCNEHVKRHFGEVLAGVYPST